MTLKFDIWYRLRLDKKDLALGVAITFFVMTIPLGYILYGVLQERKQLLASVLEIQEEHLRAIQFRTRRWKQEGLDCFWVRDPKAIASTTTALRQADPLTDRGHVTPVLKLEVIIHFMNGTQVRYIGDIYLDHPEDVFLHKTYWLDGYLGYWRPKYLPVRIPGWAPWLIKKFEQNGCPGIQLKMKTTK